ncbi:hypothetical protein Pan14r_33290 [Crateriforma conspicua]|uniref:Uncharacterized protein n=1 Tax=Crateriforma conspicua TaxID=2527996 RepID=A0A5C5Y7R8_9PLAN|nr:hypothetical protein Pan14r_33290 [Crateriforma conspicua]
MERSDRNNDSTCAAMCTPEGLCNILDNQVGVSAGFALSLTLGRKNPPS